MASRPAYDLKTPLIIWNASLSGFSFLGALRVCPELLFQLSNNTFSETICAPSSLTWGTGATGLWVQLFVYSKIPELFDTFFIVARKKPLMFLHWYHHVSVLGYCWHSYATEAPQALSFVTMNYLVHSIMYGYYCLMAMKMKPTWLSPVIITVMQIAQMIMGTLVQLNASYKYITDESCDINRDNVIFGGLMYASYLTLFTQFAMKRYGTRKNNSLHMKIH